MQRPSHISKRLTVANILNYLPPESLFMLLILEPFLVREQHRSRLQEHELLRQQYNERIVVDYTKSY